MQHTIEYQDEIVKIITALYPQAKIYLFGSFARGTHKGTSDIDIAVDVGKNLDIHQWQMLQNLVDALPIARKIDLVIMQRLPEDMQKRILNEGILWTS